MMFSLNVNSIRDVLKRKGKREMKLVDLPRYTHEHLGLRAINLSTNLLAGIPRSDLERIRDNGDKVGCTCLLLSESTPLGMGDPKRAIGDQCIDRAGRVLKAAHLLGCNAASIMIKSKDNDDAFDLVCNRMRKVLEVADAIDINLLISPTKGLTEDPERVTKLVKGIGGFRIGTFPDFASASESGDPVGYLRRLTPYASVINATTLGFADPEENEDTTGDSLQNVDGLVGLDALAAELEAMDADPAPVHIGYDLVPLVGAIKSVGFDGNIALDYRGGGDGTLGVLKSRDAIEAALLEIADS